jgi:hypothetical protein
MIDMNHDRAEVFFKDNIPVHRQLVFFKEIIKPIEEYRDGA